MPAWSLLGCGSHLHSVVLPSYYGIGMTRKFADVIPKEGGRPSQVEETAQLARLCICKPVM